MVVENATMILNETVNQTAVSLPAPLDYAVNTLAPRVRDLVLAPAQHPDMLWTLAPMIIALVLMQLYFGRNKDEALGWNTAFGNSIALVFISASLLRELFILSGEADFFAFVDSALAFDEPKIVVILLLFAYGIFLAMISFFHWIPEGVAFFIMNGISINSAAYVVIVLVNSEGIPLDEHTVAAGVAIFLLLYVVSVVIRSIIPQSRLSKVRKLERMKRIVDSQAKTVNSRSGKTNIGFLKSRLESKADKLEDKSDKISKRLEELKK